MMIPQAIAAWLHYSGIIILVAGVGVEIALYRRDITVSAARLLSRVDGICGLGATLILLSGLARVFWFAKGAEFYGTNPIFWVKMALFTTVALLALQPTRQFSSWRPDLAAGRAPKIEESRYQRTRRILWLEAALLFLIPLLATLMARGIGLQLFAIK